MAYFPFFVDIKNKKCVVVGGGRVALRKIQKLLPFGVKIYVVGTKICTEIKNTETIIFTEKEFSDNDIFMADFVISATDNEKLNAHIFDLCKQKNIPVNTVDDKDKCTFIFPALAVKDDVCAGICTGGKSPLAARKLKEYLYEIMDDDFCGAVNFLGSMRDRIKTEIKGENNRRAAFEMLWDLYFMKKRQPSDKEIEALIKEVNCNEN